MIELADKWTRQPQRPIGVSAEWRQRGLVALFDTRAGIELIHNNRASNLSTTRSPSAGGMAADFSGTANQQYAHRDAYSTTGAMTLVFVMDVDTLSNYGALIAKQGTTTSDAPYEVRLGAGSGDSQISMLRASSANYGTSNASGSNLISAGEKIVRLVIRFTEADEIPIGHAFVNGAKLSFGGLPVGRPPTDNTLATVWIGRRYDGATQLDGRIYYVALFNRALSDSEALALTANPWKLYAKRPKRVFVTAGGSAASTIAAASGASTASTLTGSSTASTTIAGASGASTASTLAASSVAVSTAAAASGASTAQTLSGLSVTVAAISAASGATTAATIAGSSTAATTASAANGAATASTLAGASTAVSTLSAASGVSTASTLTGVAGSGSTIGVADGVSTAATITASSVAVSTISASSGASSDQIIVGAAFAEAAISGASGASTCSTLTGGNAAGLAAIEVAAGISSAQIIVGSSFAAAAIAAATGVATCSTMTGLGGADAEEAYPLRGTTPSYPLSGLESSALSDAQTYPLQGLTQE
jgi:hypothetical protein